MKHQVQSNVAGFLCCFSVIHEEVPVLQMLAQPTLKGFRSGLEGVVCFVCFTKGICFHP